MSDLKGETEEKKEPQPVPPSEGTPPAEAGVPQPAPEGAAPEAPGPGPEAEPAGEPIPPNPNRRWYVVRVQTGRERGVKEAIEKLRNARGLQERIGDVLIPSEKRTEIKGGRRMTREVLLYPGYVFVSMEMSEDTWFAVRETPGVGDFLGLKDPIPLQEHEVAKMLHSVLEAGVEKPKVKMTFNVADTVRVREGPFENFEGKVLEINEKKGTVKVSMEVFGRATNVDIEYWNLEKID
jgi:transcriptional antiterminator NusG